MRRQTNFTRQYGLAVLGLVGSLMGGVPASAQILYTTGFEAPSFILGPLVGQSGWGADGSGSTAATIQSGTVRSGSRAVKIDAFLNQGYITSFFRSTQHDTGVSTNKIIEAKCDMNVADVGIPSLYYGLECFDAAFKSIGRVAVDAVTGVVNVSDEDSFFDTTLFLSKNTWNTFLLRFDFISRTFDLYVNQTLLVGGLKFKPTAGVVFGDADLVNDNRGDEPGDDVGYFDNFSVTAVPHAVVSGTITLPNCEDLKQSIQFVFRPLDSKDKSEDLIVNQTLSASGTFSLPNIPRKNYSVWIKGSKWLAKKYFPVNTLNGNVSGITVTLTPGDANDDNHCDIFDLGTLANDFNSGPGDSNWNGGRSDLNCSGGTDIFDLALLAEYFNTDGDPQ